MNSVRLRIFAQEGDPGVEFSTQVANASTLPKSSLLMSVTSLNSSVAEPSER
jgi:hypothetical protein